jgi:hypothetical protein
MMRLTDQVGARGAPKSGNHKERPYDGGKEHL